MYDLVIEDATIVSSQGRLVADIATKGGTIAYVGPRARGRAKNRISAIGKFLMPGIIDLNVQLGAPFADSWASGTRSAAAGGVTTVIATGLGEPNTISRAALRKRRKEAKANARVNFGFWAAATGSNDDQVKAMLDDGALAVEVRLGGDGPTIDTDTLARLFAESPGLLGIYPELGEFFNDDAEEGMHNQIRPPEASEEGVRRIISLVKKHNRRVHICNLTTAAELHLLDPLKGDLPISTGVTPHHLFLNAESHQKLGHRLKCEPPLRDELDRRSLWTALKRQRIDAVSSNHRAWTLASKEVPYLEAPNGIPGLESTFCLMMFAVHHGRIGLERMVELLSEAPAAILGLGSKGRIDKGADADLVLFSEGTLERLDRSGLHRESGWSPYVGREVSPRPDLVVVNGNIVAARGEIMDDKSRGTEVRSGT